VKPKDILGAALEAVQTVGLMDRAVGLAADAVHEMPRPVRVMAEIAILPLKNLLHLTAAVIPDRPASALVQQGPAIPQPDKMEDMGPAVVVMEVLELTVVVVAVIVAALVAPVTRTDRLYAAATA
jgi:hypothetical protein